MAKRTETEAKALARLDAEIIEAAKVAHAAGVMNDATYDEITIRQLARVDAARTTKKSGH